jgi:hypothetical protein
MQGREVSGKIGKLKIVARHARGNQHPAIDLQWLRPRFRPGGNHTLSGNARPFDGTSLGKCDKFREGGWWTCYTCRMRWLEELTGQEWTPCNEVPLTFTPSPAAHRAEHAATMRVTTD